MKFPRYGICKECGKRFIEKDENFTNIKNFWNPDICMKCRTKLKQKKK